MKEDVSDNEKDHKSSKSGRSWVKTTIKNKKDDEETKEEKEEIEKYHLTRRLETRPETKEKHRRNQRSWSL